MQEDGIPAFLMVTAFAVMTIGVVVAVNILVLALLLPAK